MNYIQSWKCLPYFCLKADFFFLSLLVDVICRRLVEFQLYLSYLGFFSVKYFVKKKMYICVG